MDIKREVVDAAHERIVVKISPADYADEVAKKLKEIAPTVEIKGFRRGQVPARMIEKMYGTKAKGELLYKSVSDEIDKYIKEQKLDLFSLPLPCEVEGFDLAKDDLVFEFEIGLKPDFKVDLEADNQIIKYEIETPQETIDEQLLQFRIRFGNKISQTVIDKDTYITGIIENKDENIYNTTTLELSLFKDEKVKEMFIGKQVGDVITLQTGGLFINHHILMPALNIDSDAAVELDIPVSFTIESLSAIELPELNQEFYDRVFGGDFIHSEEELRNMIKEENDKRYKTQTEHKFVEDVRDFLLDTTNLKLPANFIKKLIISNAEKPITMEEVEEEYENTEKYLRLQLIEEKLISEHNIRIGYEDIERFAARNYKARMIEYGYNPSDDDAREAVARALSDKDHFKRVSAQVLNEKIQNLFKEKVKAELKKVSVEEFIEEMKLS